MNSSKPAVFLGLALLAIVIVIGGIAFLKPERASLPAAVATTEVPDVKTTKAPWDISTDSLKSRLEALNLPRLKEEGTTLHIHQHLDIYINGEPMAVPPGIGVNEAAGFISPIHTHDKDGVIHVESPVVQTFTLGQFFGIWGVRLTRDCLGGYCQDETNKLRVFVDGNEINDDPNAVELTSHQEIAIIYGDASSTPKEIPSSYTFAPGL
jgi:hypothetical protein